MKKGIVRLNSLIFSLICTHSIMGQSEDVFPLWTPWFLLLSLVLLISAFFASVRFLNKILKDEPTAGEVTRAKEVEDEKITPEPMKYDFPTEVIQQLRFTQEAGSLARKTVHDFTARLAHLYRTAPQDSAFTALLTQYQIAIENERFYERTIWQIAAVLIPASFGLAGLGFKSSQDIAPLIAGLSIYLFFLLIFSRFRVSLRLFREYALFLESVIGLYGHTFVYEKHFSAFGHPVRIWAILVGIGGLFFNFSLYQVFQLWRN